MDDNNVTLIGRVATGIEEWRSTDGTLKVSFRFASTERRRDKVSGEWGDGRTLFVTVSCWRTLAENASASLRVGDPLVVRGRMFTREYETDSRRGIAVELEASAVALNLAWCSAKAVRPGRGPAATIEAPQDGFARVEGVLDVPDSASAADAAPSPADAAFWDSRPRSEQEESRSSDTGRRPDEAAVGV